MGILKNGVDVDEEIRAYYIKRQLEGILIWTVNSSGGCRESGLLGDPPRIGGRHRIYERGHHQSRSRPANQDCCYQLEKS